MSEVNMSSILAKCREFSETPAGKRKIQDAINEMAKNGVSRTGCGSEILTEQKMNELAEQLISTIKSTAASYDLASSVMEHFDNLAFKIEDLGNGTYQALIYFADDLNRDSLYAGEYTSDGINNIVALFNNGYAASKPKYGWWAGHKLTNGPDSPAIARGATIIDGASFIEGTQNRPSLRFMQKAIQDFEDTYKAKYNLEVTLSEDYD